MRPEVGLAAAALGLLLASLLAASVFWVERFDPSHRAAALLKAERLGKRGLPLVVKVNSHPAAGKSTFIREKRGRFRGSDLLDFDDEKGRGGPEDVRGLVSDPPERSTVLFGACEVQADDPRVIVVGVVPPYSRARRNVRKRRREGGTGRLADIAYVYRKRKGCLRKLRWGSLGIWPTFEEALTSLADAYGRGEAKAP